MRGASGSRGSSELSASFEEWFEDGFGFGEVVVNDVYEQEFVHKVGDEVAGC